jgi:quercetin 2,3-dioxygenase
MQQIALHKAESRGHADHGWLQARHTFSFASYMDPERTHFGVLRVLNDDIVAPGMGFGLHPHENMEIITIPLSGALQHKDSMGHTATIRKGDVQVMSAGTGIRHSEMNPDTTLPVSLLQIWLFPNKRDVAPRYQQITLRPEDRQDRFEQILSPKEDDAGVWIHQNAWFHLGAFNRRTALQHALRDASNGAYVFVITGSCTVNGTSLRPRDGVGLRALPLLDFSSIEPGTELLLMEVPMQLD